MKKLLAFFVLVTLTNVLFAQTPEQLNYQAVIRDVAGNPVLNQSIGIQISIISGSVTGTVEYTETHTILSNAYGIVVLSIGNGNPVFGTFANILWGNNLFFIKIEADPTGGTSYLDMGTTQLLSVPYALHAKTAENITGTITETDPVFGTSPANGITNTDITNWNNKLDTEVDGSVTNEIQALSISNDTVYLSNGGFVKLPAGFNGQYSSLTGAPTNVSSFTNDAGYLTSFTEVDGSITNELQALTLSNDTIYLSNGGFVKLPAGFNGQYSSLTGAPSNVSAFTNDAGYLTTFTEVDGSITNELQALTLSNDTIYLSNGGFVKLPVGFNGQYSSLTGAPTNVSAFTNDAGYLTSFTETDPKIGANTSGYSPKWNGSAMVTGAIYQDASNNVGIGTTTPSTKLEVSGQVKITGGTPGAGKILTSDAGGLASWQAAPGDNLGNHTATQNINLNGFALVSAGTRGLKMDSRGNIGINMAPQNTSGNDVNFDILSPDGWGHANVNLRGYNWATNSYKCTRGSGCDFYSGAWWSDTYNEHLFFLCSDGAEFAKGITIRKNSNVGIGTQAPSTKLDVDGVITATGGNSTNWNNAYGWGNHALAGYLTSYTELDTMLWKKNISDIYFNTGNVGIGTTTPTSLLHVNSSSTNDDITLGKFFSGLNVDGYDNNIFIGKSLGAGQSAVFGYIYSTIANNAGAYITVWGDTPGTTGLFVRKGGNVGIGTATPSSLLHLKGTADPLQVMVENGGGNFKTGYGIKTALQEWFIGQQNLASAGFRIVDITNLNAVRLQIEQNTGEVGIGTTTPSTLLDVNGVITATGGNSTNWNNAYGWGNHALAGYLTSEVDGSTTNEIQTLSISNDTIYLTGGGFAKIPEQKSVPALINYDDFSCTALKSFWTCTTTGGAAYSFNWNNLESIILSTNGGNTIKLKSNRQKSVTEGKLIFTTVSYTYEDNNTAYGPLSRGLVNGTDRNNAIEFINVTGSIIQARTVLGGVATTTNYAVGASVGDLYSYTIIATNKKVEFYFNGTLIATHTTNIPTLPLNMYFDASTPGGNVPQAIDDAKFEIIKY